ncbi:MAG TPA: hypothetical protein VGK00_14845 [Anaerolineales bacterium]|jgi:hypothetical protein
MSWSNQVNGDPLAWLLEPENPGVRYLALRDLLDRPDSDPELASARQAAFQEGPISAILNEMDAAGFWVEAGAGYLPKYRSSVWSIIMLSQLGATLNMDRRIEQGCHYLLEQSLAEKGQFGASGTPGSTADCLQGNLCAAMLDLGFQDQGLEAAFEWMARSVTGEGVAPLKDKSATVRYYAGKCGPLFACGANNKLSCAWGGVKVMLALGKLPRDKRSPLMQRAIQAGADFFFSVDPATAGYPNGWSEKPSQNWWKFGFPVFYVTDLLQLVEALALCGYGSDARLAHALEIIRGKQDAEGRWTLEYDYTGKTWSDFGARKQPNKWVTFRALRVLKVCGM